MSPRLNPRIRRVGHKTPNNSFDALITSRAAKPSEKMCDPLMLLKAYHNAWPVSLDSVHPEGLLPPIK